MRPFPLIPTKCIEQHREAVLNRAARKGAGALRQGTGHKLVVAGHDLVSVVAADRMALVISSILQNLLRIAIDSIGDHHRWLFFRDHHSCTKDVFSRIPTS
jgi:hypothetical protein